MRKPKNEFECPCCHVPLQCCVTQCACVPGPVPDYKLEAGCKVICEQRLEPEILTATVLAIDGGICFLRYADGVQGCYPSSALTVTAPATPEVGDFVRSASSERPDMEFGQIHYVNGDCITLSFPGCMDRNVPRDDITIICKAGR